MPAAAKIVWVPGHILVILGCFLAVVALIGNSIALTVISCGFSFLGAQALLWTGALKPFPRKRAGAIIVSLLGGGLFVFLVIIRFFAGARAWTG